MNEEKNTAQENEEEAVATEEVAAAPEVDSEDAEDVETAPAEAADDTAEAAAEDTAEEVTEGDAVEASTEALGDREVMVTDFDGGAHAYRLGCAPHGADMAGTSRLFTEDQELARQSACDQRAAPGRPACR